MDFSNALVALKEGHTLARVEWPEGVSMVLRDFDAESKSGEFVATDEDGNIWPNGPVETDMLAADWEIVE